MRPFFLYVIDDEAVAREGITLALEKDFRVKAFGDAESALKQLKEDGPDLVLLDIGLPGISGVEALSRIKALRPETLVIMITAYEDVDSVVSSMKQGAHDYLVKPLQMGALITTIRNALETISLRKEIKRLQEEYLSDSMPILIGESSVIQNIMEVVDKVALNAGTPVLIRGDTGTGKELVAKAIHYRNPNSKGALISVNCAAIPRELIESELFGYEKGAFSGADPGGKEGLVEKAEGGTLFLDEVGDLPADAQAKLLRFLESGEYYRVGSTRRREASLRVVSATNRDLTHLMQEGRFRRDLYFRIAVIDIEIPSLKQRREDILPIARHFLVELNGKYGKSFTRISSETEAALLKRQYPGNVRELKNLIEREIILSDGPELEITDLSLRGKDNLMGGEAALEGLPQLTEEGVDLSSIIRQLEKQYMDEAISMAGGNETRAAALLGYSRDTFRYRKKNNNRIARHGF
jgi:DNA-binding NtrC family response regulator